MHGRPDSSGHELIILADPPAQVEIAPSVGGSIAGFYWTRGDRRQDWLRPATAKALAIGDAFGMGCFPLVPYSNRIRNGRFSFDGRNVSLTSTGDTDPHYEHGHGWRRPWTVADIHPRSLTLVLDHPADAWPWRYRARQDIELTDGGILRLALTIANLDESPMPVGFGFHPYFPTTPEARLTARVDRMWATDAEVLPTRIVALPSFADPTQGVKVAQTAFDNVFTKWSGMARVEWPEADARLRFEAEEPLAFLVLYTPPTEPYFCVEPVSNVTDAFNLAASGRTDTGMIVLRPGQSLGAAIRFVPMWLHASN